MDHSLKVELDLSIQASPERVWQCLTNPAEIKQWLYNTDAISEWKEGSELVFQGSYEGQTYRDHGTIHEFDAPRRFRYDYWTTWSGLEDKPENYSDILFELEEQEGQTHLSLTHTGFVDADRREHSIAGWSACLDQIKEICEG